MTVSTSNLKSCIYRGWVRHRRFVPVAHEFRYRIFFLYLDLDELDQVFRRNWLWSTRRPALAWFRRGDHIGKPDEPLSESVRNLVEQHGYARPSGPIRLLTQLRYFGYVMNPVSFYYCFDSQGKIQNMVADVSNTPWGERHSYVMDTGHFSGAEAGKVTDKEFHVSPFLPMDMHYQWKLNSPGQSHLIHIENHRDQKKWLDVTMNLERQPIRNWRLNFLLLQYPFASLQVVSKIYWQAIRLKLKGASFYPHPSKGSTKTRSPNDLPQTELAGETDSCNSLEQSC